MSDAEAKNDSEVKKSRQAQNTRQAEKLTTIGLDSLAEIS